MKIKIAITFLLTAWYFLMPKVGYMGFFPLWEHLVYPFSHANIFHLLGNLLCLWLLPCSLRVPKSYLVAVIASFIPLIFTEQPTMGFSGFLFAVIGMTWGRIRQFRKMCKKIAPYIIVTLFLPNVNWEIHVYCLLFGYVCGVFEKTTLKELWLQKKKYLNF